MSLLSGHLWCVFIIPYRKEMIHIATELKTSITYTGTGSQKIFDIPFDYLRTSFVKTSVDDVELAYGGRLCHHQSSNGVYCGSYKWFPCCDL